jgi:hypothetical protein
MAAGESRELVSAVRSIASPNCAEAEMPHAEREQKAEQPLEEHATMNDSLYDKCTFVLDAGRRFTETCERIK